MKIQRLNPIGRVLIIKSLGISPLVFSASNVNFPKDVIDNVKGRLFKFLWKNKRDKIKRVGLYQDYDKGGLCMVFVECQFTRNFTKSCLNWFNDTNSTSFNPATELLFGIRNISSALDKLLNYTLLFIRRYIYILEN